MNKRTGKIQDKKPANYNEERIEERSFESITLASGSEVTTYLTDDGVRMYMDWESQVRLPYLELIRRVHVGLFRNSSSIGLQSSKV